MFSHMTLAPRHEPYILLGLHAESTLTHFMLLYKQFLLLKM